MSTLLRSKIVTARKAHRCSCCSSVCVQPGDDYRRDSILNDGSVHDWIWCLECAAVFTVVWDWAGSPWDEGVGPDSFAEWANEMKADDPRAAAYLVRLRGAVTS